MCLFRSGELRWSRIFGPEVDVEVWLFWVDECYPLTN